MRQGLSQEVVADSRRLRRQQESPSSLGQDRCRSILVPTGWEPKSLPDSPVAVPHRLGGIFLQPAEELIVLSRAGSSSGEGRRPGYCDRDVDFAQAAQQTAFQRVPNWVTGKTRPDPLVRERDWQDRIQGPARTRPGLFAPEWDSTGTERQSGMDCDQKLPKSAGPTPGSRSGHATQHAIVECYHDRSVLNHRDLLGKEFLPSSAAILSPAEFDPQSRGP